MQPQSLRTQISAHYGSASYIRTLACKFVVITCGAVLRSVRARQCTGAQPYGTKGFCSLEMKPSESVCPFPR